MGLDTYCPALATANDGEGDGDGRDRAARAHVGIFYHRR